MQILSNHGWEGWVCGPEYIFNERLGLRFTIRDLELYWIDIQRLREYERCWKRVKQYKFDFVY